MENKIKRFLSLLLALVMVIGMMPLNHVHAEEDTASTATAITTATEIVSGRQYVITSARLDASSHPIRPLLNEIASDGVALGDTGTYSPFWTITATETAGSYTVSTTSTDGTTVYLKINDGGGATLTTDVAAVSIRSSTKSEKNTEYGIGSWEIYSGSNYLNYQTNPNRAATWTKNDTGSQWLLYEADPYNKAAWTQVSVDSETVDGAWSEGEFVNAFDGYYHTKWHSNWANSANNKVTDKNGTTGTHETISGAIDFGQEYTINQFSFTPRQDVPLNTDANGSGVVMKASLYVKNADDADWKLVADSVEFAHNQNTKTFCFPAQSVRYAKFEAEMASDGWVVVSEFDIDNDSAHTYNGVATTPATCTTEGVMTYTCATCGNSYAEVIPADTTNGHAWSDWTEETPSTCIAAGTEKRVCSNDASHVETKEIALAEHSWGEGVVTTDPGCESAGEKTYTCTVVGCGETKTEAVDATGHKPGAEATCTTAQTCTVCSTTLKYAIGHNYSSVVTAPTCTAQGYTTHTCANCDDSYVDGYVDALGHTEVEIPAVEPSFDAAGATAGVKCSVCNTILTAPTTIPAKVAVAQVGDTKYESFEAALEAAKAGEVKVVTLLNEKGITITADTTYDISDVTIESAGDVFVVTGGTLTLNGNGEVKAGTSGVGSWTAVWANGGNVVINGGTYSVGGDSNATDTTHQNDVIYTKNGGTVTINGGTFLNNGTVWTLNQNDTTGGKITVYGGSFQNWDPANNVSEGAGTSFLADGYVSELKDGYYVVREANYVAQVGTTKYESFDAALAAAKAGDVKTVTLLNEEGITISADTTYDLSGVTVESAGDVFVVTAGTLTLNGDGVVKGGTQNVGSWTAVWANGGHVVINGGTYSVGGDSTEGTDPTHQNDLIYTKNGGTVTINGGTFLNDGTVWTLNQNDTNGGAIVVYGGSFQNWNPADNTSEGEHTSFLADGYVSELQDGFYVVTEAPEISGTLTTCYANEYNAGESRISGEINGLYATESVEIKLYSGETLISTTKLAKTEYLPSGSNGSLTVKIEMGDDSSSWDTTWVEGHPRSDYQPDKAVLYLDGQQMNTVDVNMWANDYYEGYEGQSWVWAELTGVAKVVAKVGETNYLTLADAVEAANAGDTVTLLGNATGAGVVIDKNITIDLGTYTYTINSAVGSAGTETNGFQIKSGNDVTIKNGTLAATTVTEGKAIKMLVQNYANLTLEDVTLDGTGSAAMQYVLSNNSGEVEITGKTNITAPDGAVAFDVYDYSSAGYDVPTVNVSTTGTISGKIEVSKTATLNISSGTYTVALDEAWCAEGFVPVKNADGTYGVTPALPTATVTPVENEELTFALNFKADEVTEAQLEKYSAWYADFVLTVNKEVTFNANGGADGYLSGQYDAWSANWVNVPFEDVTLNAGESLKIMEYAAELMNKAGLKLTYNDVYNSVKDFDCGVFFTPEFLAANSDLVVTLELRMYNNEDETESYAIGETYMFEAPTVVAKVGDKGYATLADAVAAANAGETVTLLADTNGDGIKINKNITIDLNEKTYTIDGTLVGSAKTQSNGFQILKGNEVIIKNGAIVMDDKAVRGHDGNTGPNFVIQNYADLTLEAVNITGNNETTYVVSINSGKVAITSDTSITVNKEGAVAFDVYKSSGYEAPVVNVDTTGTITGKIEVTGGELALNDGIIDGALVYESGTVTKAEAVTLDAPENYEWVAQDDGTYLLTEEVVEPELFDLVGANMTLGNSLDINFFVDPADVEGITDAYAVITKKFADGRENVVVTANQSTWKTYQGLYYFSLSDISAKELADQIEVVVYNADGEAISNVWYDSGREYGMRLIKQQEEAETPNAEHLTFAVDMLNYGAAAQNSFEYNTDDLANNKLTTAQQAYATQSVTITNSQVKDNLCAGATLLLQNRIQLNFIYKTTDITEGMYAVATYTNHRGVEQSVNIAYDEFGKVNSTYTYIPVVGAAVADCRADITLTLYSADGTVVSTTVDSVESYCARIATSSSDPLYTMIMKLCDSAYALFH